MAKLGDQMRKIARIKKGADPLLMDEVTYDSDEVELKKLFELVSFSNKTVLAVGCGVGRITTRISRIAKEVYAIDVCQLVQCCFCCCNFTASGVDRSSNVSVSAV